MDDVPTNPHTLVTAAYFFASIFALGASYFWTRFVAVRQQREREGGPVTTRWLTEAGSATALALFSAAVGFLISLTL